MGLIMGLFQSTFIRVWACSVLILSFLAHPVPLKAGDVTYCRLSDYTYYPITGRDGYLQAWNVSFQGSGYSIFVTYLISNIGPGSLNSGVSVLINRKGKSRVGTAEFSVKSLKGQRGRLNFKFGDKNKLAYTRGTYEIKAGINDTYIDLKLRPAGPGVRISGGRVRVNSNPGDFLRADIPVIRGYVRGTLTINGKKIPLKGVGGVEHILSNISPHKYARGFRLTRTLYGKKGLVIGRLRGTSSFPGKNKITVAYLENNRILKGGVVKGFRNFNVKRNGFSGYTLPYKTVYYLEGNGSNTCRVVEEQKSFLGGFYVLSNISVFLRGVLRLFFAKPYILHFRSKVTLHCDRKPGAPESDMKTFSESFNTLSSFYLINK